ncbi:MAG: glutamate--cysteine ligase [Comamonadaceae bacterium]|nr:glutamate--cysteine ligase [Comamonadaceae bacterium]
MPLDRTYERRLGALVNGRSAAALQGGLKGVGAGVAAGDADGADRADAASAGAGLGAHQRARHDGLLRGADRAGHAAVRPRPGSWCSTSPTCTSSSTRTCPTTNCSGRPACPAPSRATQSIPIARVRLVERRPHEDRLPPTASATRYGRVMQAIAGVHFNYSFPEHFWPVLADVLQSPGTPGRTSAPTSYFALLRNYRRHGWIVLYLFGNSPALCPSFLQGRKVDWPASRSSRAACTRRTRPRCA